MHCGMPYPQTTVVFLIRYAFKIIVIRSAGWSSRMLGASCYCLLRLFHLQIYITEASMNILACDLILSGNSDINNPEQIIILVLGGQAETHC